MYNGAVIGFGNIVQKSHLPAFYNNRINDKIRIKAVVEPNERNRTESSVKYPALNFYASFEEMIKNEKIDFVDIAVPPGYHKEYIEKGIANNLDIICEKPFALNLEEAKALYDKLKKYSGAFVACHQYKYSGLWKEFKDAIQKVPEENNILLQFNIVRSQADAGLRIFQNPWRTDKQISGGGILADTGVHYIYLSMWMLGRPVSVRCHIGNITHNDYYVEDTALLQLVCERGISQVNLTWGGNRRHNSAFLNAQNISLQYMGGTKLFRYYDDKEDLVYIPDPSDKNNYVDLYVSLLEEFVDMINRKKMDEEMLREALLSVKILDLAYKSYEEDKTIGIDYE